RHDHGVLDRLRLREAEDLRAEILAAVGPADPPAGDRPGAQVDSFRPRGVDEDLVPGPRGREVRDARRVELEGEVRLRLAAGPRLEVVRPQHRLDDAEEAPQDPVLVEARYGVELCLDLASQCV